MRGRAAFLSLSLAGALAWSGPALAQLPPLDPAALELARVLMRRDPTLYGDADLDRARARIENLLLAEPGACNAFVSACRSAAAAAAERYATAFRDAERERQERITAYLLAETLRPEEMARFAAYLGTEEGSRLFAAIAMLREGGRSERRRRELDRELARTTPGALAEARAMFRRNSRNLPAAAPR